MEDYFGANGINLFRCNVGDKYVLEVLQREGLNFGGEQSGHIVFSDYAKTGDGLASALQTIAYVLSTGKPASVALNPFELYPQLQEAIAVKTKKPLEEIDGFSQILKELDDKHIRHLIRYSGTENKLRVLLEGKKEAQLAKELDKTVDFLRNALNA